MKNNVRKLNYGDNRREWKPEFVEYMQKIVAHKNYKGMPDAIDDQGQIRWNAPSNRPPGKWQDLRDRRLTWWEKKAKELGIPTTGKWISQVAKALHPFKEKPCQTCGKSMMLDYVYPTKNTIKRINKSLPSDSHLNYEDFLTIYETVPFLVDKVGDKAYEILVDIFPSLEKVKRTENGFIRALSEHVVPSFPRGKLSPGAMSNAPDRLDGFHTYNLCCRPKQDTGRVKENLKTYTDDRRAFEFWCEGDWAAASLLMTLGAKGKCSECGQTAQMTPDHVGPISLGFTHLPWFKPLCSSCNSSKGNRLSLSDVKELIVAEKRGVKVSSSQIKVLWNSCKHKVDSNMKANKLSKLLRINQHYYLLLLKEIYDFGHPEILLLLLSPELAEEKIEFVGLNASAFTFKKTVVTKRANTYSRSKAARMIRIAFDALDNYASKKKRNIHTVPPKIEFPLRNRVFTALKEDIANERKQDAKLGKKLFEALKSNESSEERATLVRNILNGQYKPSEKFTNFHRALLKYTYGIGSFLANNRF